MTALRSAVAVFAACLALSATAPAHAQPTAAEPSILMEPELLMAGLANNHNDLYFRRIALQALAEGRPHRAIRYLRRAAEYADKPAQALMAEILWQGSHGQQQDRAAAYAWMDLAAERGYPELLQQREAYWAALDPRERELALAEGEKLYARYGDDVSRPRLANQLRRHRGVALRGASGVTILALAPGASSVTRAGFSQEFDGDQQAPVVAIPGHKFYDPVYWEPELYFAHQDRTWRVGVTEVREGSATVGPLDPVRP